MRYADIFGTLGVIMFVVTVHFEAYPDRASEFLDRVRNQAADSLANEKGCQRFDVCIDPAQAERVFLYEIYADEAAFQAHLASAHYEAFNADAATMLRSKVVEKWEFPG
jgi:autoinducer 2-degrading protein